MSLKRIPIKSRAFVFWLGLSPSQTEKIQFIMILKSFLFYDNYKPQATSKKNYSTQLPELHWVHQIYKNNYYQVLVELYWVHQIYKNKDSVDPSKLAWVIVFFYYKKQQATSQQLAVSLFFFIWKSNKQQASSELTC